MHAKGNAVCRMCQDADVDVAPKGILRPSRNTINKTWQRVEHGNNSGNTSNKRQKSVSAAGGQCQKNKKREDGTTTKTKGPKAPAAPHERHTADNGRAQAGEDEAWLWSSLCG